MAPPIVINATHLGERLNGIGAYILNLLREWTRSSSGFRFEVYAHPKAATHLAALSFPDNFSLRWVSPRLFGDTDNFRRFLYSNALALAKSGSVIFNPSQFEMTFLGARQVVTIHDIIPLQAEGDHLRTQRTFYRVAVGRGLKRAAAVIVPSRATSDGLRLRFGTPAGKIRMIPYGVRVFPSGGESPVRGKYILFAGRIVPYRNIEKLVEAFLRVQHRIEHDLVLVGEASYDLRLPPSDRIVRLGYVSDGALGALYRGASAFVFPSLFEGFGFPPLEAMACGCPVIASRESSLPEVCGDAALLIDPRSVDAIAEALCRVLLDEELGLRMARLGLDRAAALTWQRSAREHLRVFEEVCGWYPEGS